MLLTCPNCGAEYEVPDGMIPAAGRHVQCSSCHTRWFVAGAPRPVLSEEQILHRLETWAPRPRPVAVTPAEPAEAEEADEARTPEPPTPIRRAAPSKPGEMPTVARPAAVALAPAEALPAPVAPLRPALRLDLDAAPAAAAPPARRSRFGVGLLLALLVAALAFAAYQSREQLAARVPAAAPALAAYGDAVDDLRTVVEDELAPLRKALAAP